MNKERHLNYWRPLPGVTNRVRILPARKNISGASWLLKVGKHFVDYYGELRVYLCSSITYHERCAVCNKYPKNKPRKYGVFNIIDRKREEDGVLRWEAPWSVLKRVMKFKESHESRSQYFDYDGKFSLFDEVIEVEKRGILGRDLNVFYNPKLEPWEKYKVALGERRSLGREEQTLLWSNSMEDLRLKVLYPKEDYGLVEVKMLDLMEEIEPGWRG
jgi:hypothetical protein